MEYKFMRGTHSKPGEYVGYMVRVKPVNGVNYVFTYDPKDELKIGWIPKSEGLLVEKSTQAVLLSDNSINVGTEINLPTTMGTNDFTIESWVHLPINKPTKKQTMLENLIETNKQAASQAAYLEAGRLANVTLAGILAKRFPDLPETPFNALVLANIADQVAKNLKPNAKLAKLTGAMTTVAFMELYQMVDLEGMIWELMNDSSVKQYLNDD